MAIEVALPENEVRTGEPRQLECMEVWGGNRLVEDAVTVHGMDAWVLSIPWGGAEVGGDIHFVSMCGAGKIARFAVADVSGHGPAANDLATKLRSLMRKHIGHVNQASFVKALNREFGLLAGVGSYATALLTTYFAPTDHLVVCNAGHPPPLWYRAGPRTWQVLRPETCDCLGRFGNLPLGIIEPTEYVQYAIRIEKGDLIVMCTDSLIESRDPQDRMLGEAGLLDLLRGLDPDRPDRLGRCLLAAVDAHRNHRQVEDDVTVMVLHHNATDPPPMSIGQMVKVVCKMVGIVRD